MAEMMECFSKLRTSLPHSPAFAGNGLLLRLGQQYRRSILANACNNRPRMILEGGTRPPQVNHRNYKTFGLEKSEGLIDTVSPALDVLQSSVGLNANGEEARDRDALSNTKLTLSDECKSETEVVTVTLSGRDHADAVSNVLSALGGFSEASILDIRHSVVRGHLTMVVKAEVKTSPASVYRGLLLVASRCGLSAEFFVHHERDEHMIDADSALYVVTLISSVSIEAAAVLSVLDTLSAHELYPTRLKRLNGRSGLHGLDIFVRGTAPHVQISALKEELYSLARSGGFDVSLQDETTLRQARRLVVFDMDSTLIQQEVIDELAKHAGVGDKVKQITEEAMGGRLDFSQSLARRVALLKGTPESVFDDVIAGLEYTKDAKLLARALKTLGYKLAVISGGFTRVSEHVRKELGLDYDYANVLEVGTDGCFTGRTVGPVVNAQRKADLLTSIAQQERFTLDQVIAIGDGANDLPMLSTAGLGIAFNAKPAVQEAAQYRINTPSLAAVLYLLRFSQDEQEQLCQIERGDI